MDRIKDIKSISIWIFIVPFLSVNLCLILITQFQSLYPNQEEIIHWTLPYIDGGASISRVVRPYPSWIIFKPAMFLTSYLLIKYWICNIEMIKCFNPNHKHIKKILFYGIASAIALTIHSIFLGITYDNDIYKLFRRIIMLLFILLEVAAQSYLVITLYSFKEKLKKYINKRYLKIKLIIVSILIVVALISIPVIAWPGNTFKFLKHALEWDYFLGVIVFYLLSHLMWKKN